VIVRLLRRGGRDISCEQAVALVTGYLEDALSSAERSRLERHLAGCPHCTEYLAQIRATIGLTHTLRTDELTPQMQEHFIELYRRWSADEE
jgi:anti-sigma factor RsiW